MTVIKEAEAAGETGPARSVRRRIMLLASVGLFLSGYNNFVIGLALIEVKPALLT